ncbi:non-homologous end joining protein Ku [Pseudonocardia sp. TRM90224]|uniref:non-homologous end joining protein Ku n=1 Tax=Pseudonocardia sp. TRM90224 TaxID=2812678 RepID=UPI001E2E6A66|nr:Ku protein [Pseudonocardia sp. TRM90224]
MARSIWTGSISFGLVSIPVGLYSATEDHTIHFHQYERDTTDRIRYQRVNERTGKEVEFSDIVNGRDVNGDLVVVEPEELDSIAPGRSRTIEITTFVDLDDINPIFFQKTYWLAPSSESSKPYALLREAMRRSNRAGIATFVMRGKEYLTAIRADDRVIALETLFFADEIRDPKEYLDGLPDRVATRGKEMDMALNLIDSMSGDWRPGDFHDSFRDRVEKLITDKHKGREIAVEAEPPEPTDMADLVAALERSVEAARAGKRPTPSKKASKKVSKKQADLSSATKAELGALARELGVEGRSKMSRDELEKAVTAAGKKRKAS